MAIDFNPDGKKTLLSIDGGGTRGIITLMMLDKLEHDTGKPCYELFDYISGTSVGAIIAGGIAVGKTAAELLTIFEQFIDDVFNFNVLRFVFRHGFRYLYPKDKLRQLLLDNGGDKKLRDVPHGLLITIKDMGRAETIFFTNTGPGAAVTQDFTLADVIDGSLSAPVYFEPVGDAVDGGVGVYGNTCYVSSVEAMDYLSQTNPDWRDGNVIHLSFGTGLPVNAIPRGQARTWLPFHWPLWIVNELLDEASEINVNITRRHYGSRMDFRRYQVALQDEIVTAELGITIPGGMKSNDLNLDSASRQQVELMKAIGRAFAANLDFTQTGDSLRQNPPPGYGGVFYPSRRPPLTPTALRQMFDGRV